MKSKFLKSFLLITASAFMLVGCGSSEATVEGEATTETTEVQEEVAEEEAEEAEPAETSEEETEESTINPPVIAAVEAYDSVISGLSDDQYYAFADMCDSYDVLLVADGVYDFDGNMASIDATLYGLDADNNVIELGQVSGGHTAYPLSIYEGCLLIGNNSRFMLEYVDGATSSVITKRCVEVSYDEDGNATYSYYDLDSQSEGQTEDDTEFNEMMDLYNQAIVINFTPVGENQADAESASVAGTYTCTFTEEMEGEVLEFTNTVVLNDDGTCEVTIQDTISGQWADGKITLDDGSEFEFNVDGDTLNLDMGGVWFVFNK